MSGASSVSFECADRSVWCVFGRAFGTNAMRSFSLAKKKNPFQAQRERELERKKREEEEAAAVYADFAKSFDADDTKASAAKGGGEGHRPGCLGSGGKRLERRDLLLTSTHTFSRRN